ncbi:phenylalanine 4-monooxygenase [Microlunatus parietis]|uniref:Phenylalanine-4-hydroxylase n=1 Tax=Microlunatus parietis TaxID=682979 RepID=A0A7Y9IAJ7_9ACTN|nr:phenylalanine 4-monooxygenase [Microlunatus parietis]NYE73162.1 phenylalanine-4-hydroxylase [Microlunatus parietis]
MFEEAQLYSPVTTGEDGTVTVHLSADHPGRNDPAYRERRNAIAAQALTWTAGTNPPVIDYLESEQEVWRTVQRELAIKHEKYACRAFRDAAHRLNLPKDRIPQLSEVTVALQPLTGFRYVPAAGIVPVKEFYGALADREFHSTQYIRHASAPLYTPEPDLIHEVIGHANLLADPQFAEINRLAGEAARRSETDAGVQFVADVFWFTIEFGVVYEGDELRAYGAGILSSYGEIEEFRSMTIRPLDFHAMGTIDYDITHYQDTLFAAPSMEGLVQEVCGFFAGFDDDTPARLVAHAGTA